MQLASIRLCSGHGAAVAAERRQEAQQEDLRRIQRVQVLLAAFHNPLVLSTGKI